MDMFGRAVVVVLAVALRRLPFSCNARARTAGRSLVGLLYHGLRGAGRAVRMCMRCAVRDNIITIITTITTTMVLTLVPTYRARKKMRTGTCLVLRRHHAVATISRALPRWELMGWMMTMPWYE